MNATKNPEEQLLESKTASQPVPEPAKKDNRPLAILFINIFALSRSILSILFKYANQNGVSFTEFMVWRNIGLYISSPIFLYLIHKNPFKDYPQVQKPWVYFRACLGHSTFLLSHYALALIPLALHTILFQTSPFWTSILGFYLNKEKIQKFEYVAMALCLLGVALIAIYKQTTSISDSQGSLLSTSTIGIVLTFLVAWMQAGINVVNRKLKDVHYGIITFYHCITAPLVAIYLLGSLIVGNSAPIHSAGIYFALFAACCFDFLQLCSMNIAFQNDSSGFVAILGYISVVYGFIADELIFNQSINGMELIGAALILVVCVLTAVYKLKLKFDHSKTQK